MRLSAKRKQQVLDSCKHTRPGAKLHSVYDGWAVFWHETTDCIVRSGVPIPRHSRWRSQLIVEVSPAEVWWSGTQHEGATRTSVLRMVEAEAEA